MTTQWYESPEGMARLKAELEAVEIFNAPREPELKVKGKRLKTGHLVFVYAFRPLATRSGVVGGEIILSSRHPDFEPIARIDTPRIEPGAHLTHGEYLRELIEDTIPQSWAVEAGARCPCMFSHTGTRDAWKPAFTAMTAVVNLQSWFLNYLCFVNIGKWPFDGRR